MSELANRFGISRSSVVSILGKHGIRLIHRARLKPRYDIDETFFSVIDTPIKAQILGFVYADGSMSPHNRSINISVAQQDEAYLEGINRAMKHTKPIYHLEIGFMVGPKTGRVYPAQVRCTLNISRSSMYRDAEALGLCPRKTYIDLPLPSIPDHLIRWFILGLFEGDGCISHSARGPNQRITAKWSVIVGRMMGKQITEYLARCIGLSVRPIPPKDAVHTLSYSSQNEVTRLMSWLYETGTGLRMERKHQKWQEIERLYAERDQHGRKQLGQSTYTTSLMSGSPL